MKIVEITDRSDALTVVWEGSGRAMPPVFAGGGDPADPRRRPAGDRRGRAADRRGRRADRAGRLYGDGERAAGDAFHIPAARNKGIGGQLLRHGIRAHGVHEVTVNEQDPQAVGFYAHMGSAAIGRVERGRQGGPYPLPIMALR